MVKTLTAAGQVPATLRARQSRSLKTEARILDAAEAVFAEAGFKGTHLTEIAERAGHSIGAVYGRFRDKEAIFRAVIARMGRRILAEVNAEIDRTTGRAYVDRSDIRRFIAILAGAFTRERGLVRAIIERSFEDSELAASIRDLREAGLAAIRDGLAASGAGLRKPDLDLATRVVQQMLFGYLVMAVLNRQALVEVDDARGIDELADAIAAYLGVPEEPR